MNFMLCTLLSNTVIRLCYILCVTEIVLEFNNPTLCWWYLLVVALGFSSKISKSKDTSKDVITQDTAEGE